jgi:hypothetical protein
MNIHFTSMMGAQIKSTQKLLKSANRETDAGFYNPPKGYAKHAY